MEYVWGVLIIVVLVLLTVYYGWRQVQTLAWLRQRDVLPPDDRDYYRRRSYRRLLGCGLTLLLALLFAGLFWFDILGELDRLVALGRTARETGTTLTAQEREFLQFGFRYLGAILAVLFAWLCLALVDFVATRRYGQRKRKRIRDDREAMLARQLPLLRRSRNGAD